MSFLLIILVGVFIVGAATALVRGLRAFFLDSELMRQKGHNQLEAYGELQNRMMSQRVLFQGIAIVLVALIGALASSS